MFDIRQTATFEKWFVGLRDGIARKRIAARIALLEAGHFGDAKRVGVVSELRVDHGPGYRVYFVRRGEHLILLLAGGDKRSQRKDIERAAAMAAELDD